MYFLRAVTVGLIKIGVADDAAARLRGLRAASPDLLEVLGVMVCNRHGQTEKELLRRFEPHRSHGEWFRPSDDLLSFIDANARQGKEDRIFYLERVLATPDKRPGRQPQADPFTHGEHLSELHARRRRLREIASTRLSSSHPHPGAHPMTAPSLTDLIVRVERATGPDRELDRDIARELLDRGIGIASYTASLDAALALVEAVRPNHGVELATPGPDAEPDCQARAAIYGSGTDYEAEGPTLPLALCLALLRSVEASPTPEWRG